MQNNSIPYEQLPITNNFMFCKVFSDKEICKEFLEILLKIEIDHLEEVAPESVQMANLKSKIVRFDVFAKSSNKVFDIELQMTNNKEIPLRSRYYQAVCDIETLNSGKIYSELKESYIIFLCPFDFFKKSLPIYTFKSICLEDRNIMLEDKTQKLFINFTKYDKIKDVDIKAILKYFAKGESTTSFTDKIIKKLLQAHGNQTWRRDFMTWDVQLKEEAQLLAQDIAQDMAQDLAKDIVKDMTQNLVQQNRLDNALNFLKMGLSVEQVAQGTELSIEEVYSLAKQL